MSRNGGELASKFLCVCLCFCVRLCAFVGVCARLSAFVRVCVCVCVWYLCVSNKLWVYNLLWMIYIDFYVFYNNYKFSNQTINWRQTHNLHLIIINFILFSFATSCLSWGHGLRQQKLLASVAVPPAPVRVPSQRPLAPSVASVMSIVKDKGDNEMISGAVHRSPIICLTIEENTGKPQLGDSLMKRLCDQSSPQEGSLFCK